MNIPDNGVGDHFPSPLGARMILVCLIFWGLCLVRRCFVWSFGGVPTPVYPPPPPPGPSAGAPLPPPPPRAPPQDPGRPHPLIAMAMRYIQMNRQHSQLHILSGCPPHILANTKYDLLYIRLYIICYICIYMYTGICIYLYVHYFF